MKTVKNIVILLAVLTSLLHAQRPTIGDAMRQAQPPKELTQPREKSLVEIDGVKPIYKPKLVDSKEFNTVFVKQFNIEGNSHIKSEILLPLLNSYKNKKLTFNDMQIIATILTKKYREEGYIVARAYIPVQNMDDAILQIVVIEGKYGKFKLLNNSRVSTPFIQSTLDNSKEDGVINNSSLERALLNVNDIPGVIISNASIASGKSVGSSDFLITVDESQLYDGYTLLNNYGGRYTGVNQLTLGLNIYSPLKIGDKFSFTGLVSNESNLVDGSFSYSVPLNTTGLRAEVGYAHTNYTLYKEFKSLDATGSARRYYAKIMYPLVKKRAESLSLFIRAEKNTLSDETRSTNLKLDKSTRVYRLGFDYSKTDLPWFNLNQQLRASMLFTYGELTFTDDAQKSLDEAGANTAGNFSKFNLSLQHDISLTSRINLENSLSLQHVLAPKNLDGSEDFSIGGAYGVKLYPNGEVSAENGYIFKTEAKYRLPYIGTLLQRIGCFYDRGRVDMQKRLATFQARTLQDIGVAYYINYKNLFGNIQVSWKIDNQKITTEPDENYKILYMAGFSF